MSIKLYSRYRNSAGQRVRTTLNLKNVPYEYIAVENMQSDDYQRINPQRLLPAIEIDGRIFSQSTAIIDWLERTYPDPSVFPEDPKDRMDAISFSQFIACEIHPIHNHRVRDYLTDGEGWSEDKSMAWYAHWISAGLTTLETMLRQRPRQMTFCYGDSPSVADIYLVPVLFNARWYGFPLDKFPLILGVEAACSDLEAFRLAGPEMQPDYPGPNPEHR
ncbi:MAG: maleylacetoacetate isomerase [Rhodospirillales bacterium]